MEEWIHALQNTILNTNYYQTNKFVSFVKQMYSKYAYTIQNRILEATQFIWNRQHIENLLTLFTVFRTFFIKTDFF